MLGGLIHLLVSEIVSPNTSYHLDIYLRNITFKSYVYGTVHHLYS